MARHLSGLEAAATSLAARLTNLGEAVAKVEARSDSAKTEIDQIVSDFRKQYGEFQSAIRSQFDSALKEMQQAFADAETAHRTTHEAQTKAYQASAEQQLAMLKERNAEAEKIVESIGTTGLTGNYKRIAEAESKAANWMRTLSIIFMTAGLIAIGSALYGYNASHDLQASILRIVLGLAFAAPAAYVAYESARHRANEIRARKVELELAALGPFMVKMPELKQIEVREKLVERFFGQPLVEPKIDLPPSVLTALTDALQTVSKFIPK